MRSVSESLRPNRVQPVVCQRIIADVLGADEATRLCHLAGLADLPERLLSGPRDLTALSHELQPFVDLYRALQTSVDQTQSLALIRTCIINSGLVSHASDADTPDTSTRRTPATPLNLTSPPPAGFTISATALQSGFDLAMQHFSCEGILIEYSPDRVQFHITGCNWCKAMHNAGAPELIPFICETDERFMDEHPTHRLRRPTAIGLGDSHCDFQFAPK